MVSLDDRIHHAVHELGDLRVSAPPPVQTLLGRRRRRRLSRAVPVAFAALVGVVLIASGGLAPRTVVTTKPGANHTAAAAPGRLGPSEGMPWSGAKGQARDVSGVPKTDGNVHSPVVQRLAAARFDHTSDSTLLDWFTEVPQTDVTNVNHVQVNHLRWSELATAIRPMGNLGTNTPNPDALVFVVIMHGNVSTGAPGGGPRFSWEAQILDASGQLLTAFSNPGPWPAWANGLSDTSAS